MLRNLKLLRNEYGISQQRLADAIHVSQPSINKYENHSIEPEIEILKRMADFFNTSVDYIVGYTDERNKPTYFLTPAEAELVKRYDALTDDQKRCIDVTIRTFRNE